MWNINGGSDTSISSNGLNATGVTISPNYGGYATTTFDPYTWETTVNMRDQLVRLQLQAVMKDELKNVTLDIDNLNKLLNGSQEDKDVAIELLKSQTKYTWRILDAFHNGWKFSGNAWDSLVYEINGNNGFNFLSKDWQ